MSRSTYTGEDHSDQEQYEHRSPGKAELSRVQESESQGGDDEAEGQPDLSFQDRKEQPAEEEFFGERSDEGSEDRERPCGDRCTEELVDWKLLWDRQTLRDQLDEPGESDSAEQVGRP